MYLSNIEVIGFKSFAHRVNLKFDSGVTAIVGPNGCGKTNIVDAIRWALGEQRYSTLRSDKMEDVIFNGTRDEKPLSMAEVTLIFSNEEGRLPVEYSEVSVTRRLFRSGESEYLLNNKACRLKDIVDLFLNTGLGADSYSIIESKMIETILSEDPSIRRSLFEEAAGVAKYRLQKRAAQRRMESTTEDLLRLQDIVEEVEKRLRALRRQASKARVYAKFSAELKEIDLKVAAVDRDRLQAEEAGLDQRIAGFQAKREGLKTELDAQEHDITQARESLEANENLIGQIQGEITAVAEAIQQHENKLAVIRERRSGIEQAMQRREQEIKGLLTIISQYEVQAKSFLEQSDTAARELQRRTELLRAREAELARVDSELISGKLALSEARRELMESMKQAAEGKEQLAITESRHQNAAAEHLKLQREREALEQEREQQQLAQAAIQQRLEAEQHSLRALADERGQLEEKVLGLQHRIEAGTQELGATAAELISLEKEQQLLADLQRRHEGYSQGVQHILNNRPELAGQAVPVAEALKAEAECQRAVEALLGERLHWLIVPDRAKLKDIAALLKSERCGTITLVPLDAPPSQKTAAVASQGARPAGEAVACDDRYKQLVQDLLRDALIVDDGADLWELQQRHPGCRLASRSGDVLEPWGGFTTGTLPTGQFGLLERQQRLDQLQGSIAQAREHQELRARELAASKKSLEECRSSLGKVGAQIEAYQRRAADAEKQLATLQAVGQSREQRWQSAGRSLEELQASIDGLQADLAQRRQANLEFDETHRDESDSLAQRDRDLAQAEQRREDLAKSAAAAAMELAQAQSDQERLRQEVRNVESRRNEALERIQLLRSEDEAGYRTIAELQHEDEATSLSLEDQAARRRTTQARREELQQQSQRSLQKLKQAEEAMHRTRMSGEELQSLLSQSQLDQSGIRNELDNLRNRVQSDYELDLAALQRPAELDLEAARPNIAELRLRIKKLGLINFDALNELDQEEQRFGFLTKQRDDLLAAKDDLAATIKRIDETARTMFLQTLDGIKTGFVQIFQRLFIGGEADIRLTGSDDPLEAEIEILATPLGKNMKSITLLSGGEKALTAIALLFGIYLVKPAPFCVLDEVDAPLDDANVQRFCAMLKDFVGSTQFMVITHNKRTMEIADRLYGVTMERLGVSKVVSVKFE